MPYVDYFSPMVYPSHYGPGVFGFEVPNDFPYEVIDRTLEIMNEQSEGMAMEIRPWIQDFGYGPFPPYSADQVRAEMQAAAVRWGFHPDQIGLVTGNRRVNADATVLVVVAEILVNRLLHREAFSFDDVGAVVMDEFHSFADPERGIVWELALALLPPHVRTLLLSATVGNALEFTLWLSRSHSRRSRA